MRSSGRLHARSGLGSLSTFRASRRRNVKQGTSPSINAEMDKLRGSASDVVFLKSERGREGSGDRINGRLARSLTLFRSMGLD
jgi:hypothetical protein